MAMCLTRLLALLAVAATQVAGQTSPARLVSEDAIMAHVRYLSDDALEGRAAGTRGERLAALYIGAQFRRLGFAPAGDSGAYTKQFPIVIYRGTDPSRDFVARPPRGDTLVEVNAGAVFVGYGISAPQYKRDDYGNADVRGKIVIALQGSPLTIDSSRTLGSYYGEATYKRDEAARRGAVALLLLNPTATWDSVSRGYSQPAYINTSSKEPLKLFGLISPQRAAALGIDVSATAPRDLGMMMLRTTGVIQRRLDAHNVVACLPGLSDERVMIGAHYDAYGIGNVVNGDSIYNGALDNASGTATMLAAAEAIARSGVKPKRSICFIAFGAEERGLLGSQAFIAQETNPSGIVAMLNIDGANLWGQTRDIAVLGDDQSTLGDIFARAAAAEGLTVTHHRIELRQRFYFRSDHLSFARVGVPSVFVRRGNQLVDGGPEKWQQYFDEYYASTGRYHKPSDELLPWYKPVGAAQQARVLVRAALEAANSPERPRWVDRSEFRSVVVQ